MFQGKPRGSAVFLFLFSVNGRLYTIDMDWAKRRRLIVWVIIAAVAIAILAILSFAIFYKTPTCFDHKQNQDETGIDCGGSCSTVCTPQTVATPGSSVAQPATVRFTRALSQSGRTDVIAYIDNPNHDAYATAAHLTLDVYTSDDEDLRTHLSFDIPAGKSVPVFIPGAAAGGLNVRQVFLAFDAGYPVWTRVRGQVALPPTTSNIIIENQQTLPRVTATLSNPIAYAMQNVVVVATVFDASGNAVAASQTVVPTLPAQGTAPLVFTWNEPFSAPAARVELVPLSSAPTKLP